MSGFASESNEDKLIEDLLSRWMHTKYLVDVGAWDGATWSNSLHLIDSGWEGLCIEPSPGPFRRLSNLHLGRTGVKCLPLACADRTGTAELFFGSDGAETSGMATLCREENEWFSYARSEHSIRVPIDTLTNIMRATGAPRSFGLLSIDTEGMDYEVLVGLDFDVYRPLIIITEEYEWNREKHAAKFTLLIRNDYSLVQKIGSNTIWLDRKAEAVKNE